MALWGDPALKKWPSHGKAEDSQWRWPPKAMMGQNQTALWKDQSISFRVLGGRRGHAQIRILWGVLKKGPFTKAVKVCRAHQGLKEWTDGVAIRIWRERVPWRDHLERSSALCQWIQQEWGNLAQGSQLGKCYGLNVCECHPKWISWTPNSWRQWYWDMGLWEGLQSWGWDLMNGWYLIKKMPQISLTPSTMWTHSQQALVMNLEEGPYQNVTVLVPWSRTSQPPELWERNFSCF